MCAVVPDSPDDVSIYNGRGTTREEAMIGAVMEAVERQTAAVCAIREHTLAPADVDRGLDLAACGLRPEYADQPMPFVDALDLCSHEMIAVPKALVQMPWRGIPGFASTHTNGLAAALTWVEAVHHALFELLERHLWAVTHARAHLRPKRILCDIFGDEPAFVDDPVPQIAFPTHDERIDWLTERIERAGLQLRLVAMQHGDLPVGMLATVSEKHEESPRTHVGCGCSWSPAHAAVQAITEAMQARVASAHAARENILRFEDPPGPFSDHTRRRPSVPLGRWYFDGPTQSVDIATYPDSSASVEDEVRRAIGCIAAFAQRIAVVDLSPADGSFAVVRAIVPELETTLIDGRTGAIVNAIVEQG